IVEPWPVSTRVRHVLDVRGVQSSASPAGCGRPRILAKLPARGFRRVSAGAGGAAVDRAERASTRRASFKPCSRLARTVPWLAQAAPWLAQAVPWLAQAVPWLAQAAPWLAQAVPLARSSRLLARSSRLLARSSRPFSLLRPPGCLTEMFGRHPWRCIAVAAPPVETIPAFA